LKEGGKEGGSRKDDRMETERQGGMTIARGRASGRGFEI
jgi:hypothetical protein